MLLLKKIRRSGFTLIELLVVIAIIGVLASIVLASLNNARRKSRDARRITDIKQIQLALELFFDGELSVYPTATVTCGATDLYGLQTLATEGYIPQVPRDPLSTGSNRCYMYAAPATSPTSYHLGALLEDTSIAALTNDRDCNSATAGSCGPGAAFSNPFSGLTGGATATRCGEGLPLTGQPAGGATGEQCYDVTP